MTDPYTSLIDNCGCVPSMDSGFDYGQTVTVDKVTELHVDECVRPKHGMTGSRFEFDVDTNDLSFVHLGSMTLNVKVKVQNAAGVDLTTVSSKPGFVNAILASLWSSVVVKINDREIAPLTSHYPGYKAVISNLLSYNKEGAKQLRTTGFTVEDGKLNDTIDDNFPQFAAWKGKLKESGVVSLSGPLPLDICSLDNMLPPGIKLSFILEPSPVEFHLLCATVSAQLKTTFQDMFLQFRRVRLPPAYVERVLSTANTSHHRFVGPYTHLSVHEVPAETTMHVVPVYPPGHVRPKHVVVAQVPTENFRGSLGTNPYVFPHLNLCHLALRFNDVVKNHSELKPDFAKGLVAREYYRLCSQTGKRGSASEGTLITEENFLNNHTLFPFDLTPDECNSRHLHLSREGKMDVEMKWSEGLPKNTVVLVLSTFDQIISVDPKTKMARSTLI